MSPDGLALLLGTALALGGLAVVLYPLFAAEAAPPAARPAGPPRPVDGGTDRERAVEALREIEFDRETGKLSDTDYAELKAEYTQEAIAAMRAEESAAAALAAPAGDAAEAAVLAYRRRARECARCGPRPEPDASYCSSCGTYLPGRCGHCGAEVTEPGAAFCVGCGHALAA